MNLNNSTNVSWLFWTKGTPRATLKTKEFKIDNIHCERGFLYNWAILAHSAAAAVAAAATVRRAARAGRLPWAGFISSCVRADVAFMPGASCVAWQGRGHDGSLQLAAAAELPRKAFKVAACLPWSCYCCYCLVLPAAAFRPAFWPLPMHNGCFWPFLPKNYSRQISILGTNK